MLVEEREDSRYGETQANRRSEVLAKIGREFVEELWKDQREKQGLTENIRVYNAIYSYDYRDPLVAQLVERGTVVVGRYPEVGGSTPPQRTFCYLRLSHPLSCLVDRSQSSVQTTFCQVALTLPSVRGSCSLPLSLPFP